MNEATNLKLITDDELEALLLPLEARIANNEPLTLEQKPIYFEQQYRSVLHGVIKHRLTVQHVLANIAVLIVQGGTPPDEAVEEDRDVVRLLDMAWHNGWTLEKLMCDFHQRGTACLLELDCLANLDVTKLDWRLTVAVMSALEREEFGDDLPLPSFIVRFEQPPKPSKPKTKKRR